MELLEAILIVTKCESAKDLKKISPERKLMLAQALEERVPSGLASIDEWNELLLLFMDGPPASNNKNAKKRLIAYLRDSQLTEENN